MGRHRHRSESCRAVADGASLASGKSEWKERVEMASGNGEWKRRVETANGNGEWKRRVETASGNGEGKRRMETPNGNCEWKRRVEELRRSIPFGGCRLIPGSSTCSRVRSLGPGGHR